MTEQKRANRRTISEAHVRLGKAMRRTREARGVKTRQVPGFSTGHISNVENGYVAPSPELVDIYVKLGGNGTELHTLYGQMRAASDEAGRRRRQGNKTEIITPPQNIDEVTTRDEVQRHYIVELNEASYTFTETGSIEDVRCKIALRAKTPGVLLYYAGHSYEADRRRGVLQAEPANGASLIDVRESETGALQSYFLLDRSISPTDPEPYALSFRIKVNSTARSRPSLRYHATTGNQQMVLRARFRPPALPRRLWWFAVPDVIDAEHVQPGCDLPIEQNDEYRFTFDDLIPGWCYGFGWLW